MLAMAVFVPSAARVPIGIALAVSGLWHMIACKSMAVNVLKGVRGTSFRNAWNRLGEDGIQSLCRQVGITLLFGGLLCCCGL